ncbi:MAG: hypothetical protein ACW98K_02995 [Candidatus Kariarchaeaceae archaeon]
MVGYYADDRLFLANWVYAVLWATKIETAEKLHDWPNHMEIITVK